MNGFTYHNPVKVVFGNGTFVQAGEEAAKLGKRAFVVSYGDGSVAGTLARLAELLDAAGVASEQFLEVVPNPPIEMVARGVERAKAFGADFVIGIGGGSAMDAAKAVAAGVHYTHGDLWNMVYASHSNVTAQPPESALPLLLIPTLPATGSEMNMCSVVSSTTRGKKSYIWADCLFAKTAILDPELTYTLPPFQTACGSVDAISHVLEIYINGQDKSDLLHEWQLGLMRTIVENLPVVLKNPTDPDARAELMWCATCGLNGWASPGTPTHVRSSCGAQRADSTAGPLPVTPGRPCIRLATCSPLATASTTVRRSQSSCLRGWTTTRRSSPRATRRSPAR